MKTKKANLSFETLVVHGENKKNTNNAINTPIYYSSNFEFDDFKSLEQIFNREKTGYIYTRWSNPTRETLETKLALLEHGETALAFASGMGAISATILTYLQLGDHIIFDKVIYGCTFSLITNFLTKFGITYSAIDLTNSEELKKHLCNNTKVVFFESITNPTLKLIDIKTVADVVYNFKKDIKIIVDNTFATPYNLNPLLLGANLVIHSGTKFISGHNDALCGIVIGTKQEIMAIKQHGLKDLGANLSPMDAYLVIRGLATLSLRVQKATTNAIQIANFLKNHHKINKVIYLGLQDHPQYALGQKMLKSPGTIIAFEINGTILDMKKFLNNLKLIKLAVSFGGLETLIEHPMTQTHKSFTDTDLENAQINDNLIRISCGIEAASDLISDLENSLI